MRAAPLGRGAVGRTVSATPTVPGAALKGNGGGGGGEQPPRGSSRPPLARVGEEPRQLPAAGPVV